MTYILAAIAALSAAIFGSIYGGRGENAGKGILVFKALATACAALPALWAAWHTGGMHYRLLAAGLLLCMAADVLLEIQFLYGVFIFGGAHICLIGAWLAAAGVRGYTILLAAGMYLAFLIGFYKWLPRLGHLKVPGIIYPALLCSMASLAVTFGIQRQDLHSVTSALGGVLFVVSDYILAYRTLEQKKEKIYRVLVLACYFSAIYLIAL